MIDLNLYGYTGDKDFPDGSIPARVTASHRDRYALVCENGTCGAHLKRSVRFPEVPTTGDFVALQFNPMGDGAIVALLPRRTAFLRLDSFTGNPQAVAANFDYVFITTSLNGDFNVRRLERYYSLALESGAQPVFLLTKLDQAVDAPGKIACAEGVAKGTPVIAISSVTGEGLELLAGYAQPGMTIALLGSSGVGKSTLVNALEGRTVMKVNDIREDDSKGRHTTTYRQLILLKSGAMVIDTPGMRELGMWDAGEGVAEVFDDIAALAGQCRFRDCTHTRGPGCAIRRALESGTVDEKRVGNYLKLKDESDRTATKAEILWKKQEWGKAISKYARQLKKDRY
jgi:ribosome biogenesis GTPase